MWWTYFPEASLSSIKWQVNSTYAKNVDGWYFLCKTHVSSQKWKWCCKMSFLSCLFLSLGDDENCSTTRQQSEFNVIWSGGWWGLSVCVKLNFCGNTTRMHNIFLWQIGAFLKLFQYNVSFNRSIYSFCANYLSVIHKYFFFL